MVVSKMFECLKEATDQEHWRIYSLSCELNLEAEYDAAVRLLRVDLPEGVTNEWLSRLELVMSCTCNG